MKKKITILTLTCALAFSLMACGTQESTTNQSAEAEKTTEKTDATPKTEEQLIATEAKTEIQTEATSEEQIKSLEIKDSGWYLELGEYLYAYVVLYNPNENTAIEFPTFRTTARAEDGSLLGTEDQVLSIIMPKEEFVYGGQICKVDAAPSKVDFEVVPPDDYNYQKEGTFEKIDPLKAVNVAVKSEKVVGEVENPNSTPIDQAIVVIVCKNAKGEVIKIDSSFVEKIPAGGTVPFDVSVRVDEEIATCDAYAHTW